MRDGGVTLANYQHPDADLVIRAGAVKHPVDFFPFRGRTRETSVRNTARVNISIARMTYAKPHRAMWAIAQSKVMGKIRDLDFMLTARNGIGWIGHCVVRPERLLSATLPECQRQLKIVAHVPDHNRAPSPFFYLCAQPMHAPERRLEVSRRNVEFRPGEHSFKDNPVVSSSRCAR
jgi:hypothetical protein